MVNELGAYAVMFAADKINTLATEADPWIDTIMRLPGRNGVFTILGNHHYRN